MPTKKRVHPDDTLGLVLGYDELEMYGVAKNLFAYVKRNKLLDGKIIRFDDALKKITSKSRLGNKAESFKVVKAIWKYIKDHRLFHE